MRTLAVIEFLTVDGVMQGLGSPDEDTEGGFEHGGWGAPYAEAIHASAEDRLGETTAYLFGRKTYEKMASFWPFQPDTNPIAAHMNATTKYVATRSLTSLEWPGSRVLEGPLDTAVSALKRDGDGTIAVLGSGVLAQELMSSELVDELRLFVHPLLLGTGKRLFRELPAPRTLQLTDVRTTNLGTLVLRYTVRP